MFSSCLVGLSLEDFHITREIYISEALNSSRLPYSHVVFP